MNIQLHSSVAGYSGLRLPFRGITGYLHGLDSVYERPIIAGGRVWMAYSMPKWSEVLSLTLNSKAS